MIVCICRRVSDRDIARAAHQGRSFDEIQLELGVATLCGRCTECACAIVAQCNAVCPTAAISTAAMSPQAECAAAAIG